MSIEEIQDIALAAMLHDIGAFSVKERLDLNMFELLSDDLNNHVLVVK
ncbi:MAG: hypothetical protein FWC24_07350 [Treponema sp.]|nr:hypothetical protein [Treponema sp.]